MLSRHSMSSWILDFNEEMTFNVRFFRLTQVLCYNKLGGNVGEYVNTARFHLLINLCEYTHKMSSQMARGHYCLLILSTV